MTIIPIRDLKDTTAVSRLCHESGNPVFITKNGYKDLVIMSSTCYDKLTAHSGLQEIRYEINDGVPMFLSEEPIDYNVSKHLYTIPQIKKMLDPVFAKHGVSSATLFGSYARGEETEKSDVDLLIDCDLRGLSFFGLVNDVAELLSVPVDVFAKYQLKKGSDMEKTIKKEGIRIYG